ncbi:SusD/RagB family nutrient-binding outer membrane lipoprotein [Epilithonimonas sp.]|uniref:SusD/RagB family nutrient-binding outer membrane lipoprotein n=1 Tax=Epilithonimonas sp. TaxID=2894511 RepID=UPI00289EE10F|nr:SusD/RagB family nutrient-binding outer membrane lipoprotein [Epilithonimonas sp.]
MKNLFKNTLKIIGIGAVLISCSTSDLNEDPNSAYTTVPYSLLNYSTKNLADYYNTPSVNTNNFRLVMQYWQETTYADESNYDFVTRNISNTVWTNSYVNVLQNLVEAKKIINEYQPTPSEVNSWPATKRNQLALIDIVQAFTYQDLVDTYGDIPYTTSNDLANNPLPAYSKAEDIYIDLIKRVKADVSALKQGGNFGTLAAGDNFYKGDINKWITFGNSLLLKMGITIADSNPALAQTTVTDAIAAGVMTSFADDCKIQYESSAPNYSQLYANLVANGRNDFVAGRTIIDYMNGTNDVRRTKYFADNVTPYSGGVIGTPSPFETYTQIGDFAYSPTEPGIVMNYTEVAFYLAEAAARWGIGSPATLYNTAVTASFEQWGLTSSDATAYLSIKPYDASNWKKSIGEQAWVALFNQGNQSWNTWKRLDYPVLIAPSTAVSQAEGKVPVRLQYPIREVTANPSNYAAGSASIGGDKLTTKVFWDKN